MIIKDSVTVDGVCVKMNYFPDKDMYCPQHSHTFDHLSVIATGAMRVWCDGVLLGDYVAPSSLNIKAGVKHLFLTLEDKTNLWCIHNVSRSGSIDIKEEHQLEGI